MGAARGRGAGVQSCRVLGGPPGADPRRLSPGPQAGGGGSGRLPAPPFPQPMFGPRLQQGHKRRRGEGAGVGPGAGLGALPPGLGPPGGGCSGPRPSPAQTPPPLERARLLPAPMGAGERGPGGSGWGPRSTLAVGAPGWGSLARSQMRPAGLGSRGCPPPAPSSPTGSDAAQHPGCPRLRPAQEALQMLRWGSLRHEDEFRAEAVLLIHPMGRSGSGGLKGEMLGQELRWGTERELGARRGGRNSSGELGASVLAEPSWGRTSWGSSWRPELEVSAS